MKPTVRDVARNAKVSVATVSRIINGLGGYSQETEARVLKIIEEMDYEINAIAKGLATKSTHILGILLPSAGTNVYGDVLNGIEEVAHKNGYSVVICNTGDNGIRTMQYLKTLTANQVDGIIYTSSPLSDECFELIEKTKIPCVLALTISYKFEIPYVKIDDKQAAYAATKYLIEMGHKKIALIAGNKDDSIAGKPRVEGYLQAMSDYNLIINENLIKYGDFSYESGEQCMQQLIDKQEDFTAVFAVSDDMAIGALNIAHYSGIKVPEEISIIGYDNTKIAKMSYPHLTTVSQPLYEIGKKATEKLLKLVNKDNKVESTILAHEIVERETVRKLY